MALSEISRFLPLRACRIWSYCLWEPGRIEQQGSNHTTCWAHQKESCPYRRMYLAILTRCAWNCTGPMPESWYHMCASSERWAACGWECGECWGDVEERVRAEEEWGDGEGRGG